MYDFSLGRRLIDQNFDLSYRTDVRTLLCVTLSRADGKINVPVVRRLCTGGARECARRWISMGFGPRR